MIHFAMTQKWEKNKALLSPFPPFSLSIRHLMTASSFRKFGLTPSPIAKACVFLILSSYISFRFPKVKKALGKKRLDLINGSNTAINYQKIMFDSWLTLITELSIHNPLYEVNTTFRHPITHFSVKFFTLTQKIFFSTKLVKKCKSLSNSLLIVENLFHKNNMDSSHSPF